MTVKEKIQAYDEVINSLKSIINNCKKQGHIIVHIEDIENSIPELKENENESISKEIIKYLEQTVPHHHRDEVLKSKEWVAWLEKQGNPADINPSEFDLRLNKLLKQFETLPKEELVNCLGFYLNTVHNDGIYVPEESQCDKVEPKFHEGDWVIYSNEEVVLITGLDDNGYFVDEESYIPFNCEGNMRLWTINDAKDGDVLSFKDGTSGTLLYKECTENFGVLSYCRIVRDSFINKEESGWGSTLLSPATKEQRDTLFAKMEESGYEWDAEKKELKKIEQKQVIDYPDSLPKDNWELVHEFVEKFGRIPEDEDELNALVEYILRRQKSAWSKEDDIMVRDILGWLPAKSRPEYNQRRVDWLKSLKDRNL